MGVSIYRNTYINIAIQIRYLSIIDSDRFRQARDCPGSLPICLAHFERIANASREVDGDRIGDSIGCFFAHRRPFLLAASGMALYYQDTGCPSLRKGVCATLALMRISHSSLCEIRNRKPIKVKDLGKITLDAADLL